MQAFAWNSRLARRLVKIFVLLVAVPLIVTVLMLGRVGREQIVWTARTMAHINETAVSDAGHEFRQIGRDALHQSSAQTEAISIHGLQSVSQMVAKIQKDSLSATARDFSALTNSSLEGAMRQSLTTNRSTLSGVNNEMERLFARSAQDTQMLAAGKVERAMLDLIGELMQGQARRLADSVEEHVDSATTSLTITAQVPDLRNGNAPGQKAILDALVRRYPEFNVVSVLDSSGNETAMSAPDRVITKSDLGQHADPLYFQTAMSGQRYVGVENEPTHGAPVLRIAVPVEVYRGKPVGALAARVSLADLWDQIRGARIGKQGFAYVLDGKDHSLLPARKSSGGLLERSAIVKTLQWRVVVAQPREEAMRPITALKKDIAENTRRALAEMRGNIQKSSSATAARLQQDEVRLRTETSAQVQRRSNEVLQHLLATTNRQTQAQLVRMQQALQTQTQKTQQDNNRQLIAAANAASESLSARVQPLTSQALTRADRRLSLFALVITAVSCLLRAYPNRVIVLYTS